MIPTKKKIEDVARHEAYNLICSMGLEGLEARIWDLEDKLDAINKHYGIEVERQDARYVVIEQS